MMVILRYTAIGIFQQSTLMEDAQSIPKRPIGGIDYSKRRLTMAKRPKDGKESDNWGGKRKGAGRKKKGWISFTMSIPEGLAQEIIRESKRTGMSRGEVVAKRLFWRDSND